MSDIAATDDGSDIDFSVEPISGVRELRQAALSRLSNEVTMTNFDYGIDLANELGKTGAANSIGIRSSAAIMNDSRFVDVTVSRFQPTEVNGLVSISMAFDIVAVNGVEFSLGVLVANGEVVLVP